ncbi:phasin family protein [uncultured Thiodictyon sp.]|jgi:phasin family protein|uniref:phasin family protein n=1 Tax=uncultured Thiodictyon sp. TaxID=1846217 RepID=UPI0025F1EEB4|nr:phasin family protein [uncultured Thiodictyon sp.]
MSDTKNPFTDFESLFKQMQIPGLDMDAMMVAYRKNIEAVTAATKAASDGAQALIKRQTEIVKDALEQMRVATSELSSVKDPKELTEKQAELAKQAFEKAFANVKELAEVMTKSNTDSLEIIQSRMNEGLAEIQDMVKKVTKT